MAEERLEGGSAHGAVRVGDTVRRPAGPWAPAMHALLAKGREVLTFLEAETIGHRKPRPAWVYAEDTLVQVARWMRGCHQIAAGFVPPPGAVWRQGGTWSPGLIIAHNDAATHNAAWHQGRVLRLGLRRARHAGVGSGPGRLQLGAAARPVRGRRRGVHRLRGQAPPARPVPRHLRLVRNHRGVPRRGGGADVGPRRRHPRQGRCGRRAVRAAAPPRRSRRHRPRPSPTWRASRGRALSEPECSPDLTRCFAS